MIAPRSFYSSRRLEKKRLSFLEDFCLFGHHARGKTLITVISSHVSIFDHVSFSIHLACGFIDLHKVQVVILILSLCNSTGSTGSNSVTVVEKESTTEILVVVQ